ncbi:MAG TPA: NADH-quinone oxidoreductase subunit C [Alphaproteobacteria bacterium]|nr:NADH-quinone oxidoreductase subunit C [Alphaproteobacteria bacterium]
MSCTSESPLQLMADHLRDIGHGLLLSSDDVHGEIEVQVNAADVAQLLMLLRDDRQAAFTQLIDLTAVDYPERKDRFDVVYQMLSMENNMRLRVVAVVAEGQTVPSVTAVFMAANWAEREVWDMFGIFFAGHPDLRRLLTDYGFEGHPLRKDFPLTGHVEVRYDDAQRRVINEPVHLVQEFRDFDFLSPWEGMHSELGGKPAASDPDKTAK